MSGLLHPLLAAANPRFTESSEAGGGEILLAHRAAEPASAEQLARLEQQLGGASPELLAFYRAHNGARLYARRSDPLTGLVFVPIAEMAELKSDLEQWFASADELDEDGRGEYQTCEGQPAVIGTPDWWADAIVFAYFGYTPESLIMPATGKYRGQIFIYEHDGGDDISRIASSFTALMQQITQAPSLSSDATTEWITSTLPNITPHKAV
ncbi:SMI1 / KNR4 family [Kingella potus]|uniref:SMI1 / KNR4 family n=1 Tax=Kingella potus TaxID=265175 RepID=A0A377R0F0_9NEIS|nr:SMI1/KNR4 family protein [Kingella potus]UOP00819.1 SMI1/KNR4 family protein [Kingella potus]STR00460.1 SMI1 / KNR4 family [Kingella potus]